jgi:hypothetical protein
MKRIGGDRSGLNRADLDGVEIRNRVAAIPTRNL